MAILSLMDKFMSGCKRMDRDNENGSSTDNVVSSTRQTECKEISCRT